MPLSCEPLPFRDENNVTNEVYFVLSRQYKCDGTAETLLCGHASIRVDGRERSIEVCAMMRPRSIADVEFVTSRRVGAASNPGALFVGGATSTFAVLAAPFQVPPLTNGHLFCVISNVGNSRTWAHSSVS